MRLRVVMVHTHNVNLPWMVCKGWLRDNKDVEAGVCLLVGVAVVNGVVACLLQILNIVDGIKREYIGKVDR